MATTLLSQQKIYLEGYDISGYLNAVATEIGVDTLDDTTFGDTTRSSKPGMRTATVNIEGLFDPTLDGVLATQFGGADKILTVATGTGVAIPGYFMKGMHTEYKPGGQVGELLRFSAGAATTKSDLYRGIILFQGLTSGASGFSATPWQFGALSASQKMYVGVHVTSVSGTSPVLTPTIQSDDNSGFTSGTVVATGSTFNAIGAQWIVINGPITDDWFRFRYTQTGTTPVFNVIVTAAVV